MIQKVTIGANRSGAYTLELELKKPNITGIYIKDITGLGYPSSEIPITQLALSDIGYFNHSLFTTRDINFTFGFAAGVDVEEKRQLLQDAFPSKQEIKVIFTTDKKEVYALGYVETFEPNIFSKDELIEVNILCPNPYFLSNEGTKFEGYGSPAIIQTDKKIDNGLKFYIRNTVSGIDNFKMIYPKGSLYFGSGVLKDPSLMSDDDLASQNYIKPTDTLLIDTSIENFGVFLVGSNGVAENLINKAKVIGEYPTLDNLREANTLYLNSYAFGKSTSEKLYEFCKRSKYSSGKHFKFYKQNLTKYPNVDLFNGVPYELFYICVNLQSMWRYHPQGTSSTTYEDGDHLILAVHEPTKISGESTIVSTSNLISPSITSLFGEVIIDKAGNMAEEGTHGIAIAITFDDSSYEIPNDFQVKLVATNDFLSTGNYVYPDMVITDITENENVKIAVNNCYTGNADEYDTLDFLKRAGNSIRSWVNSHKSSIWAAFVINSLYKESSETGDGWFNSDVTDNTSYVIMFDNYVESL